MTNNSSDATVRPTKKQRDILTFIERFIGEHGYSPSYREIMNGLNYTSVATVSLHVNSLIRRGHLRKRDRSARSLEVVTAPASSQPAQPADTIAAAEQVAWLIGKVEALFDKLEQASGAAAETAYDDLAVLINAFRVLGFEEAASAFMPRLAALHDTVAETTADAIQT